MKKLFATILLFLMIYLISCTKRESNGENENLPLPCGTVENCLSLVSVSKQTIPNANGTVQLFVRINVYNPNNGLKTMVLEMPPAIDRTPTYFTYTQQGYKPNTMGYAEIPTSAFSDTDSITVKYYNGPLDPCKYPNFSQQPCNVERFALRQIIAFL